MSVPGVLSEVGRAAWAARYMGSRSSLGKWYDAGLVEVLLRLLRAAQGASRSRTLLLGLAWAAVADVVAFQWMVHSAIPWNTAHCIGFAVGALTGLTAVALARGVRPTVDFVVRDRLRWSLILVLAVALRGGVLTLLHASRAFAPGPTASAASPSPRPL